VHTCLVTIHGVGFQTDTYANNLHALLRQELGDLLQPAPHYVIGQWPPDDPGLDNLGRWSSGSHRQIVGGDAWFSSGAITHVALVYTNTEGAGLHPLVALEALGEATLALGNREARDDLAHMGVDFVAAALDVLRVRGGKALPDLGWLPGRRADPAPARPRSGLAVRPDQPDNVLLALINDMAMYVQQNSHRERVRSFVHEAILRVCSHGGDDGDGQLAVVINAHSNGTVIAADVLRTLPPYASTRVKWFVTSGCALKKYNDFFAWGTEFFLSSTATRARGGADYVLPFGRWTNFYDARDPVADTLDGQFNGYDPQQPKLGPVPLAVEDHEVHNLRYSPPGGLRAHNYWDNAKEWIPAMATILREVSAGGAGQAP
jgi:hypothetical protein